jgi:hypothetical protein
MFTFFKRKQASSFSIHKYLSQDQKYLSWLNTIQREFEHNQKLLVCLHQLKQLAMLQSSQETKKQHLENYQLTPSEVHQYLNEPPQKIYDAIQKLLKKQNEMSQEHHTYTHLREAIKVHYLEPDESKFSIESRFGK